jgi:RimJ/RimL family protein N-acetyltransferase/acyl CoA:acetate/3-ketoacid CoA transferase beta subunit
LLELADPATTEATELIGEYVAALVEDGATIEVGIGKIPQAVLAFLKEKRDLGIHTEMITDSIVDLIESGAVTGARKTTDHGRVVASFCMGTRKLYDYVHNNPRFALRPTEYVNDPSLIGRQHRMTAINVALEIDLTGQVCADSLGTRFYSGIGGQVDFNRGAVMSDKGKAIIALPSTARGGEVSRIVTRLSDGAGVVTSRGDVHYVVTEHGVAYLHGKSIHERALALITVAHPDFRAQLLREAIEAKYLRPEMSQIEDKIHIGPRELTTTHVLDDGTRLTFRPIHPTDVPRVRELFYSLSKQAIYNRFMQHLKRFSWQQIANYVYIDHRNDVAIVATPAGDADEPIIAIGRYYLDPRTNRAEIAVEVRDEWQGKGLGTALLRYLTGIAKRNGIGGFVAEVLTQNTAARSLLAKMGYAIRSRHEGSSTHYDLDFD